MINAKVIVFMIFISSAQVLNGNYLHSNKHLFLLIISHVTNIDHL